MASAQAIQQFNTGRSNYNLQALNEQIAAQYRQQLVQVAEARGRAEQQAAREAHYLKAFMEQKIAYEKGANPDPPPAEKPKYFPFDGGGPTEACVEGCTPRAPCYSKVCPQRKEDECEASDWCGMQGDLWYGADYKPAPPAELRCVRDWVCGLGRTSHNR